MDPPFGRTFRSVRVPTEDRRAHVHKNVVMSRRNAHGPCPARTFLDATAHCFSSPRSCARERAPPRRCGQACWRARLPARCGVGASWRPRTSPRGGRPRHSYCGSKGRAGAGSAGPRTVPVPPVRSFVRNWRTGQDSNPQHWWSGQHLHFKSRSKRAPATTERGLRRRRPRSLPPSLRVAVNLFDTKCGLG